jgi:lipoprotein-anchoring transpeptidase ErfK/SrfK
MVFLSILTFILMIVAYSKLTHRYTFRTEDGVIKELGDLQYEFIDKYAEGEAYLFYLDQASKYALDLAFYNLAEHGGFFDDLGYFEYEESVSADSECGQYNGYEIWASGEEECYPDYTTNFGDYFDMFFSKYMAQFDIENPYYDFSVVYMENMINVIGQMTPQIVAAYRKGEQPKKEPEEVVIIRGSHASIIQSGIKLLQSKGSGVRPISGSKANNYQNTGVYNNFASVSGPYSVHVDRKNRIMVIVNNKGEIAVASPINIGQGGRGTDILAAGNVPNSYVTPTGTYSLRKESRIPNGNTVSFGTNGVWRVLEPHWRGILLHGGRNADSRLVITNGCVRVPDSLIVAMNQNVASGTKITIT